MENKKEYRLLSRVLAMVLIDIRASENIKEVKALADIFHNVPNMMCNSTEEYDIIRKVLTNADRYNSRENIKKYIENIARSSSIDFNMMDI